MLKKREERIHGKDEREGEERRERKEEEGDPREEEGERRKKEEGSTDIKCILHTCQRILLLKLLS